MLKTFAADLKAFREEKDISLKEISQYTRLNVTILENLESGDFTFQPQPYIRAFLRQYISYIGLDVEETLFDYDLARSGKYKSRRSNPATVEQEIKKEEIIQPEGKIRITEKLKGIIESPKKITEEKNPISVAGEKEKEKNIRQISQRNKKDPDITSESKVILKSNENKKTFLLNTSSRKKLLSSSILNSPIARNVSLILFAALVLLGLYSLINILFLEGSNNKPEIIRQNFDEVVKEQERKILGKRTPEEIQDSIRQAEEKSATAGDSIILKIFSTAPGTLFLVTDSMNYNNPLRINYKKNQVGTFKARKSFYISADNTETFKATINNKPIGFKSKLISKVKVTKEGIFK